MLSKMIHDVRDLVRDDHVDLLVEAPNWLVSLRLVHDLGLLAAATLASYTALAGTGRSWSWLVLVWLAVDTAVRFYASNDRAAFPRRNGLVLLGLLPLDLLFGVRLWAVLRVAAIVHRAVLGLRDVLHLAGVRLVAVIGAALLAVGGSSLVALEESVSSLADGVWWAVVTMTTVGYGDISPATPEGRVIAAALMIAGIGLIALMTGSVADFLMQSHNAPDLDPDDEAVDALVHKLRRWDDLDVPARRAALRALMELNDALEHDGPTPGGTALETSAPGTSASDQPHPG